MSEFQSSGDLSKDVYVEQVRLVFNGIKKSLYLGCALALLLVLALQSPDNRHLLIAWLTLVVGSRLLCVSYAMRCLRKKITLENASRLVLRMSVIKAFEGLAWGLLAWIVMGNASLPQQLLAMASLAGVSGNAVSLLGPIFPLYLSMQLTQLTVISGKLWLIDDDAYTVLAVGCVLYIIGQFGQALLIQRSSLRSIALRFENLDLVERLRIESERAEEARANAEQTNQAKSRFLAAASHDLRQPVHAQELFLEVLACSNLTETQQKVLGNARLASQASAEMLNTLLDFSRIEAGVIEPQRRAFHLQPLLHKLENELGSQADAKDIVYRSRETTLAVDSDPNLLELMLRNLITNAIRYTSQGGLLVGCRKRGNEVLIEVIDTGVGIALEQQSEVFREFHQLGNPERDRRKGLGLGLAITEGLARSLSHPLSLVSKLGQGSIFRLRLPLVTEGISQDVLVHREIDSSTQRLRGGRVLIIEDDAIVRHGMVQLLEDWGCECRSAENIEDALQQVVDWSVDMLVSDYRLRNNQTGAQVISAVRAAVGSAVPALIITGDTAPERLREARSSGVPLLHKPVSPLQLSRALLSGMGSSSQSREAPPAHATEIN